MDRGRAERRPDSGAYFTAEAASYFPADINGVDGMKIKRDCVYFVSDNQAVKIGFTSDLPARIATLQVGCKSRLKLLATIQGGTRATVRVLHDAFAPYRIGGEWFENRGQLAKLIGFVQGGAQPKTYDDVMLLICLPKKKAAEKLRRGAPTPPPRIEAKAPWQERVRARPRVQIPAELQFTATADKMLQLDEIAHDPSRSQKEIGAAMAALRRLTKLLGID